MKNELVYDRYDTKLNEVRFSNIFIEKRTFHFWKALLYQGFLFLYFGRPTLKIPKWESIIFTP